MPSCSIIIRAYNEEKHIARLLDGISQQTIQPAEIILVDSGSTDGTVATAMRYPVKVVHIQPEEFTFGRSLNRGIENACAVSSTASELIVIASAHVYPVYPDWLERLLAPFADPKVALTYGKQRGAPITHFSEHQVFAHWYPDHSQPSQSHPFCNNANAAIRRVLWEQQPYDETLSGLEDLDWAHRIMEKGHSGGKEHRIAYVAEAEVIHVHHETPTGVYNRYRREAMTFKRIFPQEHFHLGDFLRLVTTNIASDVWHAAHQKVLWASLASILWFRWMQFWGAYQGYRHSGPLTWQLRRTFYYPREVGASSNNRPRNVEPIRYNQ